MTLGEGLVKEWEKVIFASLCERETDSTSEGLSDEEHTCTTNSTTKNNRLHRAQLARIACCCQRPSTTASLNCRLSTLPIEHRPLSALPPIQLSTKPIARRRTLRSAAVPQELERPASVNRVARSTTVGEELVFAMDHEAIVGPPEAYHCGTHTYRKRLGDGPRLQSVTPDSRFLFACTHQRLDHESCSRPQPAHTAAP